jgi:hypothetical protein
MISVVFFCDDINIVFAKSLDKNETCHPEPFDRLRINSAKGLHNGYETLRSR